MSQTSEKIIIPDAALLYCRVSGKKQENDGSGLDTQEHRCRQEAQQLGCPVEAVFPDTMTGGGNFMKRSGMVNLLAHLDANPHKRYLVIFDDLKRYARDTEFHLALRREMLKRNAIRICLNFKFEDTPEGKFLETILAATGTLEREQNARQVSQKMKARMEQGFWVNRAAVGYKYVKSPNGGKELVFDEPQASILREALEGFASGRFAMQAEVQRFLESQPKYPKDKANGKLRPMTVTRLLKKSIYAGYVESKAWNVSLRPGRHEGIISFETHEKILHRLQAGTYAPARKDINEDFPLRGFVACGSCSKPLTAGWSKGKYKEYPYYLCQTKTCAEYGKSLPRAEVEGLFEDILKAMTPTENLFRLVKAIIEKLWEHRRTQANELVESLRSEAKKIDKEINSFLDRIVNTQNSSVVAAYENKIATLERQKLLAAEKLAKSKHPEKSKKQILELSLKFLSNPWKLWNSGNLMLQKTVLRLAFTDRLEYRRIEGYRTPKTSLPFKLLSQTQGGKNMMVPQGRIELPTSSLPMTVSNSEASGLSYQLHL
ncbi:recombinase family protein [Pararhizobium sp. IMCC21322]|uniref:recombinase family protein n=1 Tax=Pararhizobium sp. IMCC21322 TaxID=3067903 RepID=UPI0027416C6A|nr:recombinase family protein [Pararhizobium sp. IMCC21322]